MGTEVAAPFSFADLIAETPKEQEIAENKDIMAAGFSGSIPFIRFYGNKSEIDRSSGIPGPNSYAMHTRPVGQPDLDLGPSFICFLASMRPKAVEIIGGKAVVTTYNPASEDYQRIVAQSKVNSKGNMHGVEYLLWLPTQTEFQFGTFHFGGKSMRIEEESNVRPLKGRFVRFDSVDAVGQGNKYRTPMIRATKETFEPNYDPDTARRMKELFMAPVEKKLLAAAEAPAGTGTTRDR